MTEKEDPLIGKTIIAALDECEKRLDGITSLPFSFNKNKEAPLNEQILLCFITIFTATAHLKCVQRFSFYEKGEWEDWMDFFKENRSCIIMRQRLTLFLTTYVLSRMEVDAADECECMHLVSSNFHLTKLMTDFFSSLRMRTPLKDPSFSLTLAKEVNQVENFTIIGEYPFPWDVIWFAFNVRSKTKENYMEKETALEQNTLIYTIDTLDLVFNVLEKDHFHRSLHNFVKLGRTCLIHTMRCLSKACCDMALFHLSDKLSAGEPIPRLVLDRFVEAVDTERIFSCFLTKGPSSWLLEILLGPHAKRLFLSANASLVTEGKGLLSTVSVEEGTVILSESSVGMTPPKNTKTMESVISESLRTIKSPLACHKRGDMDEFRIGFDSTDCEVRNSEPLYLLQFLNHSCVPNCMLVESDATDHSKVYHLVSIKDISPWEELTVSYLPTLQLLTHSVSENHKALGFTCRCAHCTSGKNTLSNGMLCPLCGMLTNPMADGGKGGALQFQHAADCKVKAESDWEVEYRAKCETTLSTILTELGSCEEMLLGVNMDGGEETTNGPLQVLHRVLAMDACTKNTLPSTHFAVMRLRISILSVSAAVTQMSASVSDQILTMLASLLEDLEMSVNRVDPLLTGLRMYFVFARGRHLSAFLAQEREQSGMRMDDCCGAVREEDAFLQKPFVHDTVMRNCIVKCFQDHAKQHCWQTTTDEGEILGHFIRRFSVELESAGVENFDDMGMLSCITAQ
ncbi:SET domain containing protein, putative [Angomonas deanei]|uniref:SET domain containing protein, putative n=1 Tax=Angomonas deanei TaxID=59799 RepID=A0A7G2CDA6_9TRYP|nr:SET domain containing protein, putative [Angomonas deanei]